jgi:hypothetical protein
MRCVIVGAGAGARWMGSVMTLSTIRLRRADAFGRGGGSDMVGRQEEGTSRDWSLYRD